MVSNQNRPQQTPPTLDDLLRDPIVHLLMRRDGTDEETVRRIVEDAALRLRAGIVSETLAA
jgi:hypothetical protein